MNMLRDVAPATVQSEGLPSGPFSIPGPVINGAPVVLPGQVGVIVTTPPKISKVLHDAVFEAAESLSKRDRNRRKIVILISDGEARGSDHTFDEARESLLAKDIEVYAIGIDLLFKKVSVLGDYAKISGGDVFFPVTVQNIENAYSAATVQARNQYVLGYISSNEVKGAGPVFRDIDVQVVGKNLKPLHRKGYYQYP
jgi:hypothetical protein